MELMHQRVVLSFLKLGRLTVWNVPSFFTCLALGIFRVCKRTMVSSFILLEDHWVLRFCGTKQNKVMWKTDIVFDWKFTRLLVSTILVVSLAPETNSTWTIHMVFFLCMQVSFGGSCCWLQGQFQMYTKPDMPLWPQWWCKPWSCVADAVCVQFCCYSDSFWKVSGWEPRAMYQWCPDGRKQPSCTAFDVLLLLLLKGMDFMQT